MEFLYQNYYIFLVLEIFPSGTLPFIFQYTGFNSETILIARHPIGNIKFSNFIYLNFDRKHVLMFRHQDIVHQFNRPLRQSFLVGLWNIYCLHDNNNYDHYKDL